MKKKQYIIPTMTVYQVKATIMAGSETMNVDSSQQVTDDNAVFSRSNDFWDNDDE